MVAVDRDRSAGNLDLVSSDFVPKAGSGLNQFFQIFSKAHVGWETLLAQNKSLCNGSSMR